MAALARALFIFVGLGPLVGTLTMFLALFITGLAPGPSQSGDLFLQILFTALVFSYPFGAPPAALAGCLAFAIRSLRLSLQALAMGVGGLVIGAVYALALWLLFASDQQSLKTEVAALYMTLCVVASLVCWAMLRWGETRGRA